MTIENDLLIATETSTGKVIFSYDINKKISDYLNSKKKKLNLKA